VHETASAALPASVRALPPAALKRLGRFREAALATGIPAADVDCWLTLARPAAEEHAHAGGRRRCEHQLIATLDLSAIPADATDLPLPPDGHLLLFANPDLEIEVAGGARYLPAGVALQEREPHLDWRPVYEYDTAEDLDAHLRAAGELRLRYGTTLFEHPDDDLAAYADAAAHPRAAELREVWQDVSDDDDDDDDDDEFVEFQIGGHASDFDGYGDPVLHAAVKDAERRGAAPLEWVLLAQWHGMPMATLYWAIPRRDLAERRFDRVMVMMWANP
jgi:hypothetical protein